MKREQNAQTVAATEIVQIIDDCKRTSERTTFTADSQRQADD